VTNPDGRVEEQSALFTKMDELSLAVSPSSEEYYSAYHNQNILNIIKRREQRERLDNRIFILLACQVVFLVVLMLLQGFHVWGFSLNEWVFGFFINGSLIQTYLLVRDITKDLYPESSVIPTKKAGSKSR